MSALAIVGMVGWGSFALTCYLYLRLHKKYARQKGVIDGLNKQLELASKRISDLTSAANDGVRVDEAGRVRDS